MVPQGQEQEHKQPHGLRLLTTTNRPGAAASTIATNHIGAPAREAATLAVWCGTLAREGSELGGGSARFRASRDGGQRGSQVGAWEGTEDRVDGQGQDGQFTRWVLSVRGPQLLPSNTMWTEGHIAKRKFARGYKGVTKLFRGIEETTNFCKGIQVKNSGYDDARYCNL